MTLDVTFLVREGQPQLSYPESIRGSPYHPDLLTLEPRLCLMPWTDESRRIRQPAIDTREPSFRPFRRLAIVFAKRKFKFLAKPLRQPLGCQRAVPMRRLDPRTI